MEVCQPISSGGLGIRSIRTLTRALLGKWLLRLGDNSQGLWHRLILAKYRIANSGWMVPEVCYRASGMWKSILFVKVDFEKLIHFQVHSGQRIHFWNDLWCGDSSLKD